MGGTEGVHTHLEIGDLLSFLCPSDTVTRLWALDCVIQQYSLFRSYSFAWRIFTTYLIERVLDDKLIIIFRFT